jgi:putative PIN family toxin of toxin-antitoxin system
MKVFFDTNVYVAEALLGRGAERIIASTQSAKWRIYSSEHVLSEVETVIVRLGFPRRLATLAARRVRRRSRIVTPLPSRHAVARDPADSPILRAALSSGADYLITNDAHLLELDPYESLRIVSMSQYLEMLKERGVLP